MDTGISPGSQNAGLVESVAGESKDTMIRHGEGGWRRVDHLGHTPGDP
jgi:hypothetical protein